MPNIVFGRIRGTALVEYVQHSSLDLHWIMARCNQIILMQHMAKKMTIVDAVHQFAINSGRQTLEPVYGVPWQSDVERDNVFHILRMNRSVTHCGARDGKSMRQRLLTFVAVALEKIAGRRGKH